MRNIHEADLRSLANAIRFLSIDAVEKAQSGHPGMPMGMADVATVLYAHFLRFHPQHPQWPNRDRFVLSAGHGSMLLYSLLYLTGYEDMTLEDIKTFRQHQSRAAGHPEYGLVRGIETTTGPLGQGLGNAVGMAIGEAILRQQFSADLIDHFTYVIASDGCLMEGLSQEVISLAGHLKLSKLIVLFDDNNISIDGPTSLATSDDQLARFKASNWDVHRVDGHNIEAIFKALSTARSTLQPSLIACQTRIGYGAPTKEGTAHAHGAPLGAEEVASTRKALGWHADPFHVPEPILKAWRMIGQQNVATYEAWEGIYTGLQKEKKQEFDRRLAQRLPEEWPLIVQQEKRKALQEKPSLATRSASQAFLQAITPALPELVGGSADLTPSNNTKTDAHNVFSGQKDLPYGAVYLHYGVREHGMAAIMNGLALYGGFLPYGGTFLAFSDYCRPSIRLSALMEQRVIYVMTHDSIGLGEDGPTHQPVEHLASLRAIPHLHVFRPADIIETMECWEIALQLQAPSILALSRQKLPFIHRTSEEDNRCAKGGYFVHFSEKKDPLLTFVATGSEVSLALDAAQALEKAGINSHVVSMPCLELFYQQSKAYQESLLRAVPHCFVIEAGIRQGWEAIATSADHFMGIETFGASGPEKVLYQHFGLTTANICLKVQKLIRGSK